MLCLMSYLIKVHFKSTELRQMLKYMQIRKVLCMDSNPRTLGHEVTTVTALSSIQVKKVQT